MEQRETTTDFDDGLFPTQIPDEIQIPAKGYRTVTKIPAQVDSIASSLAAAIATDRPCGFGFALPSCICLEWLTAFQDIQPRHHSR